MGQGVLEGRDSLGSGYRKHRGKGGLVVGGLAPREATLSGDAVEVSKLGTCRVSSTNLLHQAKLSGQTQFRCPQTNLESL